MALGSLSGWPLVWHRLCARTEEVWFAGWRISCVAGGPGSLSSAVADDRAVPKKKAFPRAEKELAAVRKIDGRTLINWTEPEFAQKLLQIYDPPVLLYVRGDPQLLNLPSLSIVGTRKPTLYGTQMAQRLGRVLAARGHHSATGYGVRFAKFLPSPGMRRSR